MTFDNVYSRFAASFTPTSSNGGNSVSGLVHGKEAKISMHTRVTHCAEGVYAQLLVTLTYGGTHYTDIPSQELALTIYKFIHESMSVLQQSEYRAEKADKAMFNATFCA